MLLPLSVGHANLDIQVLSWCLVSFWCHFKYWEWLVNQHQLMKSKFRFVNHHENCTSPNWGRAHCPEKSMWEPDAGLSELENVEFSCREDQTNPQSDWSSGKRLFCHLLYFIVQTALSSLTLIFFSALRFFFFAILIKILKQKFDWIENH